jgi:hypothetical protein
VAHSQQLESGHGCCDELAVHNYRGLLGIDGVPEFDE